MVTPDEADTKAALGGYGDAVDVLVKVPTLSGVMVALVAVGMAPVELTEGQLNGQPREACDANQRVELN